MDKTESHCHKCLMRMIDMFFIDFFKLAMICHASCNRLQIAMVGFDEIV